MPHDIHLPPSPSTSYSLPGTNAAAGSHHDLDAARDQEEYTKAEEQIEACLAVVSVEWSLNRTGGAMQARDCDS
eukprot:3102814-Rhodomonas_salina.3